MGLASSNERLHGDFHRRDSEINFFTDPESVVSCLEALDFFCDKPLQSDHSPYESPNVDGIEKTQSELAKSYKGMRTVSDVEFSSRVNKAVFYPTKLPQQRHRPAQLHHADTSKTQTVASVILLVEKFSVGSGAGYSRVVLLFPLLF